MASGVWFCSPLASQNGNPLGYVCVYIYTYTCIRICVYIECGSFQQLVLDSLCPGGSPWPPGVLAAGTWHTSPTPGTGTQTPQHKQAQTRSEGALHTLSISLGCFCLQLPCAQRPTWVNGLSAEPRPHGLSSDLLVLLSSSSSQHSDPVLFPDLWLFLFIYFFLKSGSQSSYPPQ